MNYYEGYEAMVEDHARIRKSTWKPGSFMMLVHSREIRAKSVHEPMKSYLPDQDIIIADHIDLWDGKMLHVGFEPSFADKAANDWELYEEGGVNEKAA